MTNASGMRRLLASASERRQVVVHAEREQLPAVYRSCQMPGHCDDDTTVLLTRPGSCEIWDAISEGSCEGTDWAAAAARAPSASASASQRLMKWTS